MAGKGNVITATEPTRTMNKIKEMRAKWGTSSNEVLTFTAGSTTAKQSDVVKLVNFIQDGKNRSKWTGNITPAPSVGALLQDIMGSLHDQAEAIRVHCPCNCNYCKCNCNYCGCDCNQCSCNDSSDSCQ